MKRVKALPRHAVDNHPQCDCHPLVVCSCGACKNKETIECGGKAYKTMFQLDCKFHALLYEMKCHERANQAEELIHSVLKRDHSNALEASHSVFIRFQSKDVFLQRLHYHLSQENLTYCTCTQNLAPSTTGSRTILHSALNKQTASSNRS